MFYGSSVKGVNDFWKIIQRATALSRSILLAPVILSDGLNSLLDFMLFVVLLLLTLKNFNPGV